jgi:hypothetical protein
MEQREGLQGRNLANIKSQQLVRQEGSGLGDSRRSRTVHCREGQGRWLAFLPFQVL